MIDRNGALSFVQSVRSLLCFDVSASDKSVCSQDPQRVAWENGLSTACLEIVADGGSLRATVPQLPQLVFFSCNLCVVHSREEAEVVKQSVCQKEVGVRSSAFKLPCFCSTCTVHLDYTTPLHTMATAVSEAVQSKRSEDILGQKVRRSSCPACCAA